MKTLALLSVLAFGLTACERTTYGGATCDATGCASSVLVLPR